MSRKFAFKIDDNNFLESMEINEKRINSEASRLLNLPSLSMKEEIELLLAAISMLDLTSLSSDDTRGVIVQLCFKAVSPVPKKMAQFFNGDRFLGTTVAAVCVYPSRIQDAKRMLANLKSPLPVAAVAGGFPSGQYPLETRVAEVAACVKMGASEIDIVVDRSLVLTHKWKQLYNEIAAMGAVLGNAKMKVILATGECGSFSNIYRASLVAMHAGADFIKTSTGKETLNATFPVGVVMCRAIKFYYLMTAKRVGFKPAGGIKTYKDVLLWMLLIKKELGPGWLQPSLFRIGASSVLTSIIDRIVELHVIRREHSKRGDPEFWKELQRLAEQLSVSPR